mgnify:CR=1 FL=1
MGSLTADAVSLHTLFTTEGGMIGFKIPSYQRTYDWGQDNIQRYFEDLLSGIKDIIIDEEAKTFIGTVILVNENNREATFEGTSFAVVDGQQRLTTTSLIASTLHREIEHLKNNLPEIPEELSRWINAESGFLLRKLANCIFGNISPDGVDNYPFPRIVRHGDTRAASNDETTYRSLAGSYLYQYALHVKNREEGDFDFQIDGDEDGTSQRFLTNIETISQLIEAVKTGNADENIDLAFEPITVDYFQNENPIKLFEKLPDDRAERNAIIDSIVENSEAVLGILSLCAFSHYILKNVLITKVIATEERYAFDIFDSLNTTGEPLTAIETFKPRLIEFEERNGSYEESESKKHFSIVEQNINKYEQNHDRQQEAQETVISFALYLTGEKCSRHLNVQRRYLRNNFNSINDDEREAKRSFIKSLSEISIYRSLFWKKNSMAGEFPECADRQVTLTLLSLLSEMNHSLTIPILSRYYFDAIDKNDWSVFSRAVKALSAFIVIRRSATGGTAGIDTVFRALMTRGEYNRDSNNGLKKNFDSSNPLKNVDELKSYLRDWLTRRPINISNKEEWITKASIQGTYNNSKPLCKLILLAAAHNSRPREGEAWKLEKTRPSQELTHLTYDLWRSDNFETIEHIAPQNPRDDSWERAIYEEPHLINSIGNLSLLPKGPNSAVGNNPWPTKRLFFKAFSAPTEVEVQRVLDEARAAGVDFGNTEEMLLSLQQLPIAKTIFPRENWTAIIIKERTRELLGLAWDEMNDWLFV